MLNSELRQINLKGFRERLAHPSSMKLKQSINEQSINSFLERDFSREPRQSKSQIFHDFLARVEYNLPKFSCWRGASEEEIEDASECVEYAITKKKYNQLFGCEADEKTKDEKLESQMLRFGFIKPSNLEIDPRYAHESLINVAIAQLRKLNTYTSPRDKLICLSNCFRIVNSRLYAEIIMNSNMGEKLHGADDSLPLFVYVLLKSRTSKLFSTYYYIKYFRYFPRKEYKDPIEFRYTFTSYKIALKFILELSLDKLLFSQQETHVEQKQTIDRSAQTSPIPPDVDEVELQQVCNREAIESTNGNRSKQASDDIGQHSSGVIQESEDEFGPLTVEHLTQHPEDLERLIREFSRIKAKLERPSHSQDIL